MGPMGPIGPWAHGPHPFVFVEAVEAEGKELLHVLSGPLQRGEPQGPWRGPGGHSTV